MNIKFTKLNDERLELVSAGADNKDNNDDRSSGIVIYNPNPRAEAIKNDPWNQFCRGVGSAVSNLSTAVYNYFFGD